MSRNSEEILATLAEEFLDNSLEHIDQMDVIVERLMRGQGNPAENHLSLQREVHNIKGQATTFGFPSLTSLAHALEDYMETAETIEDEQLSDIQLYLDEMRKITETRADPGEETTRSILETLPHHVTDDEQQPTQPEPTAAKPKAKPKTKKPVMDALVIMTAGLWRKMVGTDLTKRGYRVSYADNTASAISRALMLRPRLIVASLEQEHTNGGELAQVFKCMKETRKAHFVVMTSREKGSPALADVPDDAPVIQKKPTFTKELDDALSSWGLV